MCYAGGRGGVAAVDAGELVHLYGRDFLGRDPRMALEYYMLAARAAGDSLPVKGRLLRELLTESKAYGGLLLLLTLLHILNTVSRVDSCAGFVGGELLAVWG